ncbi:hypothetical protein C8Q80DRAFT_1209835 [Daedaleopsis nitida]|nr:hypothetical protein C8Q80DRAFT_1209835 [Daedaleopsis nitida]
MGSQAELPTVLFFRPTRGRVFLSGGDLSLIWSIFYHLVTVVYYSGSRLAVLVYCSLLP